MSGARAVAVLFALAVAATACRPKFECDEDTPCAFGSVCIEGACVEAACATSQQCPIEHYCGTNRQCVPGCEFDTDCKPGFVCDTSYPQGSCLPDQCEETAVDCGYREYCNTATGECYDAGDLYCKPCSEDPECGDGNYCIWGYCGVSCVGERECPGGFECYPIVDEFGNVLTYQCVTYCWLYEDYDPGEFCEAPPADLRVPVATGLSDAAAVLGAP